MDIDEQHRQRTIMALRLGRGMAQAILEEIAVRQSGHAVVVGSVNQLVEARSASNGAGNGPHQLVAGVVGAEPEILSATDNRLPRQLRVACERQNDHRGVGDAHQNPAQRLPSQISAWVEREQDDVERGQRQMVERSG